MSPAYDFFHNVVMSALTKDGWVITDDPLSLSVGNVDFYIDLGAEKLMAAERSGERIAVDIKSFYQALWSLSFMLHWDSF